MKGQLALSLEQNHEELDLTETESDSDQQSVSFNSAILVCTAKRFAEHSGLSVGVVHGHIKKGYLPVTRIGKYTLINLALFNKELLNK